MKSINDLLHRIDENYTNLSKGQKKLSDYIKNNYDKAVFLTAEKLGEVVGVSESTVVRFAMHLGYKGYPEFQASLNEMVKNRLNSIQRMEVMYGKNTKSEIIKYVFSSDANKIKETWENLDEKSFEKACDIILNARKIYVLGIRSCEPLASFLSFYLSLMLDGVIHLNTTNPSEIFEQMVRINEDDVIIGISFPRYSKRTLKALEFAKNRKAKVISITDSQNSPINKYSNCILLAKSDMASIADSLVAPLSLINALIVAICMERQQEVKNTLLSLEDIWNKYNFYENDEITHVDKKDDNLL